MTKYFMLALLLIITLHSGHAQQSPSPGAPGGQDTADRLYKTLEGALNNYVRRGGVDYARIREDQGSLQELVMRAGELGFIKDQDSLTALFINVYNLSALIEMARQYPRLPDRSLFERVDNLPLRIGGRNMTMEELRNEIGRRIGVPESRLILHTGLNEGPMPLSRGYNGKNLTLQVQRSCSEILNEEYLVKMVIPERKIQLSRYFTQHLDVFRTDGRSVIPFINQYREQKLPRGFEIEYFPPQPGWNDIHIRKRN